MPELRKPKMVLPGHGGPIYRDAAVRALLDRLLRECLTIAAMRAAIQAELGAARTPSLSAIGRYTRRERLGLGYPPPLPPLPGV